MIYEKYRLANKVIKGCITQPTEVRSTLLPARSLLYVPYKNYTLQSRILSTLTGKPLLLLADHHSQAKHTVFTGLHINTEVKIKKKYTSINPVTNMPSTTFQYQEITVPAVVELGRAIEEKSLMNRKTTYYLSEPLDINDTIDTFSITSVKQVAGIYEVEVR